MVESCVIDYRNYENLTKGFLDDIALFCIKYHPQTVWKWFLIRISFGYFDKKKPLKNAHASMFNKSHEYI